MRCLLESKPYLLPLIKKDDKKYNRVSEYKPTGNLIYNTALLKKIENPNNNK